MTECRRCGECEGCNHHWIADAGVDSMADSNEPTLDGFFGCKHCEQRGEECPVCEGAGVEPDEDEFAEPVECSCCKGEGVIPYEVWLSQMHSYPID